MSQVKLCCCVAALLLGISNLKVSSSFAQEVTGTVRDEQGTRLPGVHVVISNFDRGAVTDTNGRYTLDHLVAGTYQLSFSYVGFNTYTEEIRLTNEDVILDVVLKEAVVLSDEVLVEVAQTSDLKRDARSVSVLEPEMLADLRGQTLGETLEALPGVTALQTGPSISKPVVRGLHSQRVLVLNAGVAQEGQQWGGEHAPEIDPFAPVEIQVIKGVSGVEYGVGAIGGVIRLDPLDLPYLPDQGIGGELSLNGFSNNYQGAGAIYLEGVSGKIFGLGWRAQTSFRKAGDAQTPDYIIRNSAFQEFNGSLSVGLKRDRYNLMVLASRFSTELGIYAGAHIGNVNDLLRAIGRDRPAFIGEFGYDISSPKQKISHNMITLHGDYHFDSGSWLEGQYGYQNNNRQEFDAHGRSNDDNADEKAAFDLSLASHSLEFKFHHAPAGNFVGVIGISGMNQINTNASSGFLIPNFRALSSGVFARESWVKDALTLEAGARLDYRWVQAWPRENGSRGDFVRRVSDYASVSGALGAIWQFAPAWSVGLNLGTGWRPPSVNELYNFGVHHGTAQFEIGNPDLDTERSLGTDITLRQSSERSRLEFSSYVNQFSGFIFLFPEPEPRVTIRGTFPTFKYQQADALLRGFEAAWDYDLLNWLTVGAQYSMVRADNKDTDEPIINMPADRLSIKTKFHLPESRRIQNTHLELEGMFVQKQTRVPANADYMAPPDGYALYNVALSSTFMLTHTPVRLNLQLHNALNTAYRDYLSRFRYFIDDPGRSLILRIQVPLGSHVPK